MIELVLDAEETTTLLHSISVASLGMIIAKGREPTNSQLETIKESVEYLKTRAVVLSKIVRMINSQV